MLISQINQLKNDQNKVIQLGRALGRDRKKLQSFSKIAIDNLQILQLYQYIDQFVKLSLPSSTFFQSLPINSYALNSFYQYLKYFYSSSLLSKFLKQLDQQLQQKKITLEEIQQIIKNIWRNREQSNWIQRKDPNFKKIDKAKPIQPYQTKYIQYKSNVISLQEFICILQSYKDEDKCLDVALRYWQCFDNQDIIIRYMKWAIKKPQQVYLRVCKLSCKCLQQFPLQYIHYFLLQYPKYLNQFTSYHDLSKTKQIIQIQTVNKFLRQQIEEQFWNQYPSNLQQFRKCILPQDYLYWAEVETRITKNKDALVTIINNLIQKGQNQYQMYFQLYKNICSIQQTRELYKRIAKINPCKQVLKSWYNFERVFGTTTQLIFLIQNFNLGYNGQFSQIVPNINFKSKQSSYKLYKDQNTLFIKNLPSNITTNEIRQLFGAFNILDIRLIEKKNKLYAYIDVPCQEISQLLKMHGSVFRDKYLEIYKSNPPKNSSNPTILIKNICKMLNQEELKQYFPECLGIRVINKSVFFQCENINIIQQVIDKAKKLFGQEIIIEHFDMKRTISSAKTLFLKNIPYQAKQKDIIQFFRNHNIYDIDYIQLPIESNSKNKGFCYIKLDSQQSYKKALSINKGRIYSRTFEISQAIKKSSKQFQNQEESENVEERKERIKQRLIQEIFMNSFKTIHSIYNFSYSSYLKIEHS